MSFTNEAYKSDYMHEFDIFLNKFIDVLTKVINGEISTSDPDFDDSISELVILGSEFGLQYGVNHRFRRCNSKYLLKTDKGVNIINLHLSFVSLIKSLLLIQTSLIECKKVFICGKINIKHSLNNLLHANSWIPGTLTNSQFVLQKYPFSKQVMSGHNKHIKNQIPVSMIVSLSSKAYYVISREVLTVLNREVVFDVSKSRKRLHQISCVGIIDTNINSIEHTNISNICINNDSRYTKKLISVLLDALFNNIMKGKISN